MRQVHEEGKAVVSDGTREKCEADVARLHAHGLWATMEHDRPDVSPTMEAVPHRARRHARRVARAEEAQPARARCPTQLRDVFEAPPSDPGAARLFPRRVPRPDRGGGGGGVPGARAPRPAAAAARRVWSSSPRRSGARRRGEVARDRAHARRRAAWLGVLNDTRLVLGTRLGVTEEERQIADDDPNTAAFAVYYWLTWLQGELIEQLLG